MSYVLITLWVVSGYASGKLFESLRHIYLNTANWSDTFERVREGCRSSLVETSDLFEIGQLGDQAAI